jgi:hypothetical protein
MLNEPTMEKLYTTRLAAMAAAWQQQHSDAHVAELGFDDRFTLLVEAEHIARDNRRLERLLKQALLRIANACVEDIDASGPRGIDKSTLRQLATCSWIHEHLNVLISGAKIIVDESWRYSPGGGHRSGNGQGSDSASDCRIPRRRRGSYRPQPWRMGWQFWVVAR